MSEGWCEVYGGREGSTLLYVVACVCQCPSVHEYALSYKKFIEYYGKFCYTFQVINFNLSSAR